MELIMSAPSSFTHADAYAYAGRCYDERMAEPARAAEPSSPQAARPATRRSRWGTISREVVITAAAEIISGGGYEEMSIRSLAAELGVAPMSLYRHIRDKDDLLDEVTDRLLARAWRPAAAENDWRAWITEAAARLRDFLVTQPAALHVYLSHPVVSAAAIERMNAMMDVLRRAGLDEEAAGSAYGALHTYTIGFAALEASRAGWTPDGADVQGLGRQLSAYTTTAQFTEGLRYLLEGISRHTEPGPEPGP
jgi:TetR/AcrR family transcriptional regulator, tetracycline repressor protein